MRERKISRRGFLEKSSVIAGALTLSSADLLLSQESEKPERKVVETINNWLEKVVGKNNEKRLLSERYNDDPGTIGIVNDDYDIRYFHKNGKEIDKFDMEKDYFSISINSKVIEVGGSEGYVLIIINSPLSSEKVDGRIILENKPPKDREKLYRKSGVNEVGLGILTADENDQREVYIRDINTDEASVILQKYLPDNNYLMQEKERKERKEEEKPKISKKEKERIEKIKKLIDITNKLRQQKKILRGESIVNYKSKEYKLIDSPYSFAINGNDNEFFLWDSAKGEIRGDYNLAMEIFNDLLLGKNKVLSPEDVLFRKF